MSKFSLSLSWIVALACATAAAAGPATPPAAQDEPLPGEYRVEGGRVDRGTFTGWRIFHSGCQTCHGVGGVGSDIAPNLVERIRDYTPRGFATKVLTSYRIVPMAPDGGAEDRASERAALLEQILRRERSARGQVVMPAWDDDPVVPPHVLDLYAYLSARADGAIGPERPKIIPAARR
jgi:mono/diheme cytochrome c family protein